MLLSKKYSVISKQSKPIITIFVNETAGIISSQDFAAMSKGNKF